MPTTRRQFMRVSGLAAAAATAAVAGCKTSPNDRIGVGIIGVGGFGAGGFILGDMLANDEVDVVAFADADQRHIDAAIAATNGRAAGHRDYRDLLARTDIDAVMIITPDHWHARQAVDACNAGKHVYCDKPLSLTISEGRAMVDAARANNVAFQVGSQQRSIEGFHRACEAVRNGVIGNIQRVDVGIAGGPILDPLDPPGEIPADLDWQMWLGPAPDVPYHYRRTHRDFRYFFDYSGGTLTDLGAHHLDIAQWGLSTDESGPVSVQGTGTFAPNNLYETPTGYDLTYAYANGVQMQVSNAFESGVHFFGTDGDVFVSRTAFRASDPAILDYGLGTGAVVLENSRDHKQNWLAAVRNGVRPICDVEVGHRSVTVCHLGNIAIELGRQLQWDPAAEQFVGDPEANNRLARPYRAPWSAP